MQIIQTLLGNNVNPLGVRSSLSNPDRMILRKESHSLHLRNNFISTIQTKPPLVTSSKFLLSREHEPSIEPLIGWDVQDINSEFPLLEFDSFDSIAPLENSNINSSESIKDGVTEILPTRIHNNTNNDILQELSTKSKGKSKSKKTNKSQQPPETKSKSRTKKGIKSSATKNVDQNSIIINNSENSLLASDQPLSVEANSETPTLQLDIASDNTTNDNNFVSIITASALPIVEDKSTLSRNINNDNLQINSGVTSSSPSADLSVTESILPSQEKIELDNNKSELAENLLIEFPLPNNVEEIFTSSSKFTNNEQQVIPEASESFNILDIPVSPTLSKQNIETYQAPSIVDNQSTSSQINLIQAKEVSSTSNSPSQDEELPNTNSTFEAITAIEPDLILESTINNFVTDNAVVDNFLTLPSALTLPDVDDAPTLLHPLKNDDNTVGAHSYAPLTHIAASNSEPSVAKNPIAIQQEIDSSVPSEFPASAPVQLTPTSDHIEDTSSLFSDSDSNEQLVTSESQSAITINVSDVSANVTSLQHNSNIESSINEFTESQATLVSPEIGESAIANNKPLDGYATIPATSPEIEENAIANNNPLDGYATIPVTSPEIGENAIANDNPLDGYATIPVTSPEIGENAIANNKPLDGYATIPATSPEIEENAIANNNPLDGYATIPATSPEIEENAIANPLDGYATIPVTSPEIGENAIANPLDGYATIPVTSPEIGENAIANNKPLDGYATIPVTSPEIGENAIANNNPLDGYATIPATSPEIGEAPVVSAISPEIVGETSSIFRKIIDHEQTVESKFPTAVTNPEISTFVDTSDNLTSPEVEQNTTIKNLPAPKGYATGGHVTDSHVENRQQIAHSDTVPAMLTPGEFVINTRDAQKNLPLLHHINTGGTPHDIILPSLQTPNPVEPEEKTSSETPTKVDSFPDTPLQLKSLETHSSQISNSLIPSSLGLDIGKQKLSMLNSPQLNPLQNETTDVGEPSPQYSSPPMIFRKANPTSNTPSEWSSVEELLNGNNDEFTSFNFDSVEFNRQNSEFSHVSESPQVFAKHLPSFRGFADGGEVTPPDISRKIEPITETIESASSSSEGDDKDDTADLEALAREIYYRLRQRIEIERERHGGFSGRLPW